MDLFIFSLPLRRLFIFAFCVFTSLVAYAQSVPSEPISQAEVLWHSDKVTHFFGLPMTRPGQSGSLYISPEKIVFNSATGTASISLLRTQIISASEGDEWTERGGFVGKAARRLPYGGGQIAALGLRAQVDLLTIEYRDEQGAYHGAVFLLPKSEAGLARGKLGFPVAKHFVAQLPSNSHCSARFINPHTIKVSTLGRESVLLPTEYKVLIYEQLIARLQSTAGFDGIYRDGDNLPGSACPELNLNVYIEDFRKGNIVLRGSTGPLGSFIGTTKLKYRAQVYDSSGAAILNKEFTATERGDNESLDVAKRVAKSVTKNLKKANAQRLAAFPTSDSVGEE